MTDVSKNIVLTGMMGAGKTSVGRELKTLCPDKTLVDIDEKITETAKLEITEIFEKYGEDYFRDLESKEVKKAAACTDLIITTGGGAVERDENISALKENGVVFYLKVSTESILKRLSSDTTRPLLNNVDKEKKLKALLAKRASQYEKADFTIDTDNKTVKEIALEVLNLYGK